MKKEANYVELCSLLFLVGVAAAILYPGWVTANELKRTAQNLDVCRHNLSVISQALDTYLKQNQGRLPVKLEGLTSGKKPILEAIPRCPAAEKKLTYEAPTGYEFKQGAVPRYTVRCVGNNHNEQGLKRDEPYFDSLYGIKPSTTAETMLP